MDEVVIFDGVLPNATVNLPQCFSLLSFDPPSSGDSPPLYSPPFSNPTIHLSII